jgi:hypothetical protein
LRTEQNEGFFEILIKALFYRQQIVLRYDKGTNTIEKVDIAKMLDTDTFIDFTDYKVIELLKQYVLLIYNLLNSLSKKSNINSGIILKIHNLTENIALNQKEVAEKQGKAINNSIFNGKGAIIDAKSSLEILDSDIKAEQEIISNIEKQICLLFGLPSSFLFGTSKKQLLDGNNREDLEKVEISFKSLFITLWKPYFDKLFSQDIKYKIDVFEIIRYTKDIIGYINDLQVPQEIKQSITSNVLLSSELITQEEAFLIKEWIPPNNNIIENDKQLKNENDLKSKTNKKGVKV